MLSWHFSLFLAVVAKRCDADLAPVRYVKCAIKTFLNDTLGGSRGLLTAKVTVSPETVAGYR